MHEHLALLTPDGQFIDQVFYYPQTSEVSQGRVPDGDIHYRFTDFPTPGTTNNQGTIDVQPLLDFSWDSEWRYEATRTEPGDSVARSRTTMTAIGRPAPACWVLKVPHWRHRSKPILR